jgi:hypothetical protein
MNLANGTLTFEMAGGGSTTWGKFGDSLTSTSDVLIGGQTTTTTTDTSTSGTPIKSGVSVNLTNLNTYDPQISVTNSGISYGAFRVQSLTLKKVRRIMADGTVVEDTTARVVYPSN